MAHIRFSKDGKSLELHYNKFFVRKSIAPGRLQETVSMLERAAMDWFKSEVMIEDDVKAVLGVPVSSSIGGVMQHQYYLGKAG